MIRRLFKTLGRNLQKGGESNNFNGKGVRVKDLKEKYGKYYELFEYRVPSKEKYNDPYNKHVQFIEFSTVKDQSPVIQESTYIAPCATISGRVEIWENSSVWYGCVIHGDTKLVRIGSFTNIQDGTIITETFKPLSNLHDGSTIIGHYVSIGHGCYIRSTTIEDECLVGMNSTLLEGSYMEKNSVLGAHSILMPDQRIPSGEIWAGKPAKFIRKLTKKEIEQLKKNAILYYHNALAHKDEFYLPGSNYIEAEKINPDIGIDLTKLH